MRVKKIRNDRAVVLLSAGLDSTVNLYQSLQELEVVRVITFDYGQRAAKKEIENSKKICGHFSLEHQVIALPWIKEISHSSLTNDDDEIPKGWQVNINDLSISKMTAKKVWVPNRNGVFLNVAAAVAESINAQYVIPGFNKEEAATFPDNSRAFLRAANRAFYHSTSTRVEVKCFTLKMAKVEIVKWAQKLNVNFNWVWPCYYDGPEICRECESCQRFLRAMKENGDEI